MRLRAFGLAVVGIVLALDLPNAVPAMGIFNVTPVTVALTPDDRSASVEITNSGTAPQELEIDLRSWSRSDGRDEGDATDDIVASPSIFIVAPGQTQLVRLGVSRDLSGDVERTYRLVATEVPDAADHAELRTLLRIRLPVFVAPRAIDAGALTWAVDRDDAARITVSVRNTGNVHRQIRSLKVTAAGRVIFDNIVAAYVLAHQSRTWTLPVASGLHRAKLEVSATEMDGSTQDGAFIVR